MTLKILPPVHEILRAVDMSGIDEIYQARLAREVLGRFREKLQAEPRAFRDRRDTALEAARYGKTRHPGDLIEVRDCATGEKW